MISVFTDIPYARTPQRVLRLDLRVPRKEQRPPLVMYIPMGGMRSCVKENAPWWLVESGFAMASIECRVSSEVTAPGPVHDCKAAVRWLRAHADGHGYCADSIGAWGHSAGGLLAALLATSSGIAELEGGGADAGVSSKIQAACDQCGAPHDFAWFARPDVKSRFAPVAENLRLYLGGPVEERAELARLVSPRTYVSRDCPPMLLIHGDADAVVPVEETVDFHQSLRAAGVDATLCILPGIGHSWDAALTRDRVTSFFVRTLRHAEGG
ncbi:MAG: alpha/beta hydrolase [Verrucomicrobia bacterium]|nr:alpha/beta hydrolase [Verrucomicrobiota bacterium]